MSPVTLRENIAVRIRAVSEELQKHPQSKRAKIQLNVCSRSE